MLHFLLQILMFQLLFLALYDIFHKKDTFFRWNRIYLIITPFLSVLLPFIKIESFNSSNSIGYISQAEKIISISSKNLTEIGITGPGDHPINWWLILYFIGFGVSLFLILLKFYKINVLSTFPITSNINNTKIVTLPNSAQAFSFWNTIYLGDKLNHKEKKQILIHEIVHVDQKHSLDQVYFEILKIVMWWNPFIYIYQSRITVLHEYLADEAVIRTISKRNYIEQLLNAAFQTQEITFVNQFFNQSLIKKRIVMLQKSKSKSISKFKYLLLIPVITGILAYTSCNQDSMNGEKEETLNKKEIKANSGETIADKEEPKCPNQNAEYDRKINNFIEITTGKNSETIINVISIETSKHVRTVYLIRNQIYKIKNLPSGKYRLDIIHGEGYNEKTVDGVCVAFFKNEKFKETSNDLDMTIVKTDIGVNVPSYRLSVYLKDDDLKGNKKNPF